MAEKKPKYKRFPQVKRKPGQGGGLSVDLPRIKEMYLSGNGYSWKAFCQNNNFDPFSWSFPWYKERVAPEWDQWKREWLKRRSLMSDEEIDPLMVDARKLVAHGRIKFVQEWSSIAKNMKALLVHLLNEHVGHAAADQKNEFALQVTGMKKLKLNIDQLSEFASAGNRIAELEARALFIPGLSDPAFGRKLKEEAEGDGKGGENSDDPSEFDVIPMGATGMTAQERTRTIAEYFDQHQQPAEPVAAVALPAPEEPDAEDQG